MSIPASWLEETPIPARPRIFCQPPYWAIELWMKESPPRRGLVNLFPMSKAMNGIKRAVGYALVTAALAGCATERYGRVQSVGPTEQASLTCEQVDVEIGKTVDFLNQTYAEKDPVSAADVAAWLGDFGIGNSFEYEAAINSGKTRCDDLVALRSAKHCATPAPQIDAKGDGKVVRALKACGTPL